VNLKRLKYRVIHPIASLDDWWIEASPKRRLDRNAANMCMLLGLMCPSLAIVLVGPVPNSALTNMSEWLQVWMCGCIFLGCAIKFHGACSGSRFWFPNTKVKICYTYGFIGAPIASSGLLVYGYYILAFTPNFIAALGGVLTPALGIGISLQAFFYWLEYRRIDRTEGFLIAQAKAVIENDSDAMG